MAKVFANAGEVILKGLKTYHKDVKNKKFPARENWFAMKDAEFDELEKMLG
jgi:ketopantoate hydroxymethyltransferase